jgi:cell division protein ZapA (FtsZ GTPase activity inhibitor)
MKTLQVMIEGRQYSLQVNETDADAMARVAEEVNETLRRIHIDYPHKDRQDCMAMALLTLAVKLFESRTESISPDIQEKLDQMESTLQASLV